MLARSVVLALWLAMPGATATATDSPVDWRSHSFGGGKARVSLPTKFRIAVNGSGTLEAQTAGPDGEIHVFFDLHLDAEKAGLKNRAEAYVRDTADKKKLKVYETGGKVFFMEAGRGTVVDGARVRNTHWQVGFGNNLVVMTLSVRESEKDCANRKQFFDHEMKQVISSFEAPGR
jgi:hypothetical protein